MPSLLCVSTGGLLAYNKARSYLYVRENSIDSNSQESERTQLSPTQLKPQVKPSLEVGAALRVGLVPVLAFGTIQTAFKSGVFEMCGASTDRR